MRFSEAAFASIVLLASAQAVHAQELDRQAPPDDERQVAGEPADEIVVTARRREEAARDVPFAITVLDDEALAERRIDDALSFFRQVPGLSLTTFDDGRFAYFQLRGIGPLSQAISPDDGSVVTYVDGVPQPVYASEFAYLDLDRIEVLRGPQGTLFGRNSQGGAINIATRQPGDIARGTMRAEIGEDEYGLLQAAASGPFVPGRLHGSLTARYSTIDGFLRNAAPGGGKLGDREVFAARGTLALTPGGAGGARFVLAANADRQISNPFYYVLRTSGEPLVEIDPENRSERTAFGLSLTAEVPLAFGQINSVTAFNGFDYDLLTDDTDGLVYGPLFGGLPSSFFLPPLDLSEGREEERRFYQEIRLSSRPAEPVAWVVGGAYFQSDFDVLLDDRSVNLPFLNGVRDVTQTIRSYAVFSEVTAPLGSPKLSGTLGVRYTRDEKGFAADYVGNETPGTVSAFSQRSDENYDLVTGRAALSYAATKDINVYATVGRGAKSGGFPRFTFNAAFGSASPPYAKSTSWTYEAGVKSRLWNGRARLDAAIFHNDVTDEQLFVLDFVNFLFVPANLDIRSSGIEVEGGVRLTRGLQLSAGLALTDAEITSGGTSGAQPGNRVPNVARFSTTASLSYEGDPFVLIGRSLVPVATLTHQYQGERSVDVSESFELPSYHNIDARLGLRFGGIELYAFGNNLVDEQPLINGVAFGPGVQGATYQRRRTFGLGLSGGF